MSTSNYTTGYTVPYTGNQALLRHKQLVEKEKAITKMQEERLKLKNPLHDKTPDQLAMARSVYGVRLKPSPTPLRVYDRIFKLPPDWDPKVKQDSERYHKQHQINARLDEANREIPILTNSGPGHRLHSLPEQFKREYARVMVLHHSVYRTNGVDLA